MTNLFAKYEDEIINKASKHGLPIDTGNIIRVDINNIAYWEAKTIVDKSKTPKDLVSNIENLPWPSVWFEFKSVGSDYPDLKAKRIYESFNNGVLAIETEQNIKLLFFKINDRFGLNCIGSIKYSKSDLKRAIDQHVTAVVDGEMLNNPRYDKSENERIAYDIFADLSRPVLYAIMFSHCKNVEYKEKEYPDALKKRNKKRGKMPQLSYKVLEIEALKKEIQIQSNSDNGNIDHKTALHVCRGHFREYTEDAPLFGTYTGKVWVPMHMRGNIKNGKVNKDYKVSN